MRKARQKSRSERYPSPTFLLATIVNVEPDLASADKEQIVPE
jgi:hypothetical protein